MPPPPRVAAVVLAAGRSTRTAPPNKLLRLLDGQPLVCHAAGAALAAGLSPVVAVTGAAAEAVTAALGGLPMTVVHNAAYAEGLATSVAAGVRALPHTVEAALFLLGDMPLVRARHLEQLLAAFAAAPPRSICVPTHAGRRGNPVLWPATWFPRLAELSGDRGARALFDELAAHLLEVPMADDAVLVDVDTEAALEQLRKHSTG